VDITAFKVNEEFRECRLRLRLLRRHRAHEREQPENNRPDQHELLQGAGHDRSLAAAAPADHQVRNARRRHGDRPR
jgi:hypothetical protein